MVIAQPPAMPQAGPVPTALHHHADPAPYGWVRHTVSTGETVAGLAAAGRTTIPAIVAKNRLLDGGRLVQPGQRLWVPQTVEGAKALAAARVRAAQAQARAVARAKAAARARYAATHYTVRSGDTLSGIAAARGMTLGSLLRANRLSVGSTIHPGLRLAVAATRAAAPSNVAVAKRPAGRLLRTLTVRPGDTLWGLAQRHHSTVSSIVKSNRLPGTLIRTGDQLRVWVPAPRVATTAHTFLGRTYPEATVAAAAANRRWIARSHTPSRSQVRAMITATARRNGVDPALALAVAYQESGWDQRQVSVANAIGVMQVIPDSGRWASDLVGRPLDLRRAQDSITAGVAILRALDRMAANQDQAIAGYYQGLGSVQSHGMYPDTKQYVASVKTLRERM